MNNTITEEEEKPTRTGTLFLVSTPIGNDDDITLRALKVLKNSDIVVCEEAKVGARTLHKYNLTQKMELLNENNELEKTQEIIDMLIEGKHIALVSDCGTPVFADPGLMLVKAALAKDIRISVVPGVTSIMTALVRSGFAIDQFIYAGFMSRLKNIRLDQLRRLAEESKTVVMLETPYRLLPLLEAMKFVMPERKAYIGCNLTMHFESHHYGTFTELYDKFSEIKFKGEFVIVFEAATVDDFSEENVKAREREFIEEERPERSYQRREDSFRGGFRDGGRERRPGRFSRDDDGGERRPRRSGRGDFDAERRPRRFSRDDEGGERRPRKFSDGDFENKPRRFSRDDDGGERRPRRSDGGDFESRPRRSPRKFEGGGDFDSKPRRTYRRSDSEGGDSESRPRRSPRKYEGGGDFDSKPRRTYRRSDSEGGDSESRPRRSPRKFEGGGDFDSKPRRTYRRSDSEGSDSESRPPRFEREGRFSRDKSKPSGGRRPSSGRGSKSGDFSKPDRRKSPRKKF